MTLDLTSGIVRILRPDGTTSGTGFVVSKDGLIVTCSHVVQPEASQSRGDPRPEEVAVVFGATGDEGLARVEEWRPYDAEDVAILQLEGDLPEGARILPLGSSAGTSDHPFQTFGFPDASPEEGIWGDGHIQGKTWINGVVVLQISSKEVTPGFSGAPVLDTATRRVVGMVNSITPPDKYGRLGTTAFATPTETLREICPALEISDRPPYLGLDAFTEADAELFFGRSQVVYQLAESLRQEPRVLAVLGPSGSGKSSVVQAGLIPSLRDGAVPGSDRWEFIVARPADQPFERLAEAGLDDVSNGLVSALKTWLDLHPSSNRLVLILDQFEELLVTCPEELRRSFLSELGEVLKSDQPVTLMLVMRDDFFARFAQEAPGLNARVSQQGYVTVPSSLEKDELREIVEKPAYLVGLDFEEGLSGLIVDDVLRATPGAGQSTALPLLEFALTQLWERREEGLLTHHAYTAIGGVTGGLARWADQAYAGLDEDMRPLARRVLTDLVHLGDESQGLPDSRRRRSLNALCRDETEIEQVHRVVQRLADSRLLVTSMDKKSSEVTVEIIHDSLIREWGRLQKWLKEDRRFLAWRQEIDPRVRAWVETLPEDLATRDEGRLLRGRDLSAAESWLAERGADLSSAEREFVEAGLDLRTQELAAEKRRRRCIIAGLAVGLAITTILAAFAGFQWLEAEEQGQAALARQLAAQSELLRDQQLTRSVLLAVESMRRDPCLEGDLALRRGLNLLPRTIAIMQHDSWVNQVAFSPDGTTIATASDDNTTRIWDASTGKEIARLEHDGEVRGIGFSPNGTTLATASCDGTARLWDASTGEELARLEHCGRVSQVAFSPGGATLATASGEGTARLWDASTGRELARLEHKDWVSGIKFSPDGAKLATASNDGTARLWDALTGEELARLESGVSPLYQIAFSPNGDKLATASSDKTARIWDASTGEELSRLEHENWVLEVAFSPDGTKLATASEDRTARIWDTSTDVELARLEHGGPVYQVAFSLNGAKLATASSDKTARIWDASNGKEIARLEHDDWVIDVTFSPSGSAVATASSDGTVRIWDTSNRKEIASLEHDDWVNLVFSPDAIRLATASSDKTARIWDASNGKEIARLEHDDSVNMVTFSPDGIKLATASSDGTARIWDASNGKEISRLEHDDEVWEVMFSPDGAKIATGSHDTSARIPIPPFTLLIKSHDNAARIWDASTGKEIARLKHDDRIRRVAFSPDGSTLATASDDGTARIWDSSNGKELARLKHDDSVNIVTFSPDGAILATRSGYTVLLWDTSNGKEIARLKHDGSVNTNAFSPDSTILATASNDNTARIWDASTGEEIARLEHDGTVWVIAFSPDGTALATGSWDGTARIWDALTGEEIARLEHDDWVYQVEFSSDGTKLATASDDHTVRIWHLQPEDLICEAVSRLPRNLTEQEWKTYLPGEPYRETCDLSDRGQESKLEKIRDGISSFRP